ncbi:MAG: hypothetical protein QE265_04855 [Rhodoferax sp.]|nr:hypothetical protein [Rhodoferax sp.]
MQTFRHPTHTDQPLLSFRGVLLKGAEARTKPLDETGLAVPVLCMDIELECSLHNVMHVEQTFEPHQFDLVKSRAKALKKGDTVDVLVPPIDIRLMAKNATHVTPVAPPAAAPTTPAPNPQEPELWPA